MDTHTQGVGNVRHYQENEDGNHLHTSLILRVLIKGLQDLGHLKHSNLKHTVLYEEDVICIKKTFIFGLYCKLVNLNKLHNVLNVKL